MLVDDLERSYIPPRMGSGGRLAIVVGGQTPARPKDWRDRVRRIADSYAPNAWENPKTIAAQVEASVTKYTSAWLGWVFIPLAADATPPFVLWQKQAQREYKAA